MIPTDSEFKQEAIEAAQKEGWQLPGGFDKSEGSAVLTYVKAGYHMAPASATSVSGGVAPGWVKCDGVADYQAEEEYVWVLQDGKVTQGKWMEAYWADENSWVEKPFTHDNGRKGTIKTPPFMWGEYIDEGTMDAMKPQPTHFQPKPAALAASPASVTGPVEPAGEQWVIVSLVGGRGKPYWRPNGAGYTDSFTDAGRYIYEEAVEICSTCHGDAEKYCVDDPALYDLIAYENLARGKEIKLWLENTRLRAALTSYVGGAAGEQELRDTLFEVRERLLNHSQQEEAHLIAVDLPELISLVIGPLPQPTAPAQLHTGGPDLNELPF